MRGWPWAAAWLGGGAPGSLASDGGVPARAVAGMPVGSTSVASSVVVIVSRSWVNFRVIRARRCMLPSMSLACEPGGAAAAAAGLPGPGLGGGAAAALSAGGDFVSASAMAAGNPTRRRRALLLKKGSATMAVSQDHLALHNVITHVIRHVMPARPHDSMGFLSIPTVTSTESVTSNIVILTLSISYTMKP